MLSTIATGAATDSKKLSTRLVRRLLCSLVRDPSMISVPFALAETVHVAISLHLIAPSYAVTTAAYSCPVVREYLPCWEVLQLVADSVVPMLPVAAVGIGVERDNAAEAERILVVNLKQQLEETLCSSSKSNPAVGLNPSEPVDSRTEKLEEAHWWEERYTAWVVRNSADIPQVQQHRAELEKGNFRRAVADVSDSATGWAVGP